MSRHFYFVTGLLLIGSGPVMGQQGGNIGYSQSGAKTRAELGVQNRRKLAESDRPPSGTTSFVEADVLMNVKADEYVAVFGISQEGETVADCSKKMDEVAGEFIRNLKGLGVAEDAMFLDFVTQTKIYGYEITGTIARERLVGFELKKNLSIHYKNRDQLDKFAVVAAQSQIYDLIKVDYVVRDLEPIHDRLADEAAKIIKRKVARYDRLLGIKLQAPGQVFAEKLGSTYPSEMYDSYAAADSEQIGLPDNQRFTIQNARKGRTFVFNALDGDGFDAVINPVVIEPVVQMTYHLKVKFEVEQPRAK